MPNQVKKKVIDFALSEKNLLTATKYLKVLPIINKIIVYLNIPRTGAEKGAQLWHKDDFGYKSLDLFLGISDIDLDHCQIKVVQGKGKKDRIVPFPNSFKEILAVHVENAKKNKIIYLFESSWKKQYTDRGIRKILMNYTKEAGIEHSISPHKLRHFLFTWMKKKGVDDALIQPYSGHDSRQSLEIYSKLSLGDCQPEYEKKIKDFPI